LRSPASDNILQEVGNFGVHPIEVIKPEGKT